MVALLQAMSINETIIDKLKDSSMGHYAITYMCYKIATPVRYTVTIGEFNFEIRYILITFLMFDMANSMTCTMVNETGS